jgi:hypothetical protein
VNRLTEVHDQLKTAFAVYVKESEKFEEHGVKVSAQRAREALQEMKQLIAIRRKEIQEKKVQT